MENNTLGKRIKEARLAKKMTQSEVVGDLKGYFNFHVDKCKVFQKICCNI